MMRDETGKASSRAWRRAAILIGATTLLVGACLGDMEGEDDTEVGVVEQAVEPMVCDATKLDYPSGTTTCSGPWTYKIYNSVNSRHNLCGTCEVFPTCAHWVPQPDSRPTTPFTLAAKCHWEDTVPPQLECLPDWAGANEFCGDWIQPLKNAIEQDDTPIEQRVDSYSAGPQLLSGLTSWKCNGTIRWSQRLTRSDPACCTAGDTANCTNCARWPQCTHADRRQLNDRSTYTTTIDANKLTRPVVTDPGKTKEWVRDHHPVTLVGQITRDQLYTNSNLQCSTAEDVPSAQYGAKLQRLLRSLGDTTVTTKGPDVVNQIVSRAKIAFESFSKADMDSWPPASSGLPDEAALVHQLYETYPALEHTCGRHATTITSPCSPEGYWRLRFCTRLTSMHVKVLADANGVPTHGELVRTLYDECIQELDALGDAVEGGTCGATDPVVAESLAIHRELQDKLFLRFGYEFGPETAPTDNSTEITNLEPVTAILNTVSLWYDEAARLVADPQALSDELHLTTNKFWQASQGRKVGIGTNPWIGRSMYGELNSVTGSNSHDILETAMGTAERRGFRLDRAVIKAAYADLDGQPAMQGPPLVRITTEALSPVVNRLEALVQFQDVGCSLVGCLALTEPIEGAVFWKVLSVLTAGPDSDPNLEQVLNDTTNQMSGWHPAFDQLRHFQQRLIDAANGREGGRLLELIAQAARRSASFEAKGRFEPPIGDRLYTGVHSEERNKVILHLTGDGGLNQQLAGALQDIDNRLIALIRGLVDVTNNGTSRAHVNSTLETLNIELQDLHRREDSFSKIIVDGQENVAVETLMEEWKEVDTVVDSRGQLRFGDSQIFQLAGSDAKFDGDWNGDSIEAVAAAPAIQLDTNQLVSIDIDANTVWSPTCALREVHMATLTSGDWQRGPQIAIPSSEAGPEGFTINFTGSNYYADGTSHHRIERTVTGRRFEGCANVQGNALTVLGGPATIFSLGGGGPACLYREGSTIQEDDDFWNTGNESRTSVQFVGGLYVPSTPFVAPVGSLIVVEMPRPRDPSDPTRWTNIHFVRSPHTTIQVTQDADLYLVVNDKRCDVMDSSRRLPVTVTRFQTVGDAAPALLKRMAHTLSLIHAKFDLVMERGEVLPSEIQEIEHHAKFDHIADPPITFEQYPAPLQVMFLKYLARETKRLEAGVRLVDIQREIAIKESAFRAALEALHNNAHAGYLLALAPQWTARGMRLRELREIARMYSADIQQYLRPIIDVWYPDVPIGIEAQALLEAARDLANVNLNTGELEAADLLNRLGTQLALRIGQVELPYPTPAETPPVFVALRFPHPDHLDPECASNPAARCRATALSNTFRWATVTQTRALWEDQLGTEPGMLGTNRHLVFQLSPEDLYQQLAGTAYLPCHKSLPVVRKIGIAATGFSGTPPTDPRTVTGVLRTPALMAFPGVDGTTLLEQVNPVFITHESVPVVFGNVGNYGGQDGVMDRFLRTGTPQDVRGVSPFTTWVFDIPEHVVRDWRLREAHTIDILLEVEATRSGGVVATPACTAP